MKKRNRISQSFQKLDTGLYQVFHRLKRLPKIQLRLLLFALVLSSVFLLSMVNRHIRDNAAWLEGTWSNQVTHYSMDAKKDCKVWTMKQEETLLLKDARIAVNSSKDDIILTNGGAKEYHLIKTDDHYLTLQVFKNHKKIEQLELHKVD